MILKVNYDVTDLFKHNHTIFAEKNHATYEDYKKAMKKLKKEKASDVVISVASDEIQPIKNISFFYDVEEDKKNDRFTVTFSQKYNSKDIDYCNTATLTKIIKEYCRNDANFFE